jgi:3-oxoacyl-[acyl-carrier protein] reductase
MDLGIAGKTALVCASSRGLGKACARALAAEGCNVVINGRNQETLDEAAAEIAAAATGGATVTAVAADLGTEEGRAALLAACPAPDILITNNDGPPPGHYRTWDRESWMEALDANMLAPIALIQATVDGMRERGFGRIVNITSAMVKAPHQAMGLSTAARSALTAFCKGLSREVAADGVTVNNLLPERFDTDRQVKMANLQAALQGTSYEEARAAIAASLPAGRFGRPEEFGATCAFVCSAHAGFLTGQNISLDGGSYPGVH